MIAWGERALMQCTVLIGALFSVLLFFGLPHTTYGATIHEYRDTLSDSAPNEYANHTIEFKTTVPIPPGGFVRFIPEDGVFEVPALDFDNENVELYVNSGSGYHLRAATTTPSAVEDGITITPGTSGMVEITLNSTQGVPANAHLKIKLGDHTTLATTTDLGLLSPPATGTYEYFIEAGSGGETARVRGLVALVDRVTVPFIDTHEFVPPLRFNGAPSGTISGTTQIVQMSLETDEFARCRYSHASNTPYFSMGNEFTNSFRTMHPTTIAVATGTTYTFFVRCIDDEGNENIDDYIISFTVPDFPEGSPGDDGENEGQGSGTGQGSGNSSPGDGSPSGENNASGGSTGGGGGGGGGGGSGSSSGGNDGSGGFEGSGQPYQSGDGRVIINGYAFPRSEVTVLVDGVAAEKVTANGEGEFTVTIDAIARGVYTFGVYATDKNGVRSSTFSTTFSVTGARGSTLSNVNVMPSIKVIPNPVNPGQQLSVTGFAIPDAVISIENQPEKSSAGLKTFTATSDQNGAWSLTIDTTGFSKGIYKIRAKAKQEADPFVSTNFSNYTLYGVGEAATAGRSTDLNRDGKVNLIDFSILLFWWNTAGGNSNPPADINGDGKVSLTDFSILIFNWTG